MGLACELVVGLRSSEVRKLLVLPEESVSDLASLVVHSPSTTNCCHALSVALSHAAVHAAALAL